MSHSGDESDEDEEGPRRSKAKARKVATKADDKVTTPKKEKAAIRRPSIQTEEVKSMIADVDSLLSKSNTNPEKEKVRYSLSAPLGRTRKTVVKAGFFLTTFMVVGCSDPLPVR